MYKIASPGLILRISDNCLIPTDDKNRDYMEYLSWISEGNVPDPADAPSPPTRDEIDKLRLHAYADPITGSDRHFNEAIRMQAMGESGWEAVRQSGIARFEEIQLQYPWPV